jgi:cellulose synthase/poly-beta-1,6-N-acetylglucosamine synthase-like glycosyltransferase
MIFLFIYWLFFFIGAVALLECIGASIVMGIRFREVIQDTSPREQVSALSMIVPLKGVDAFTASHLSALVESVVDAPVEYLFTMESMHDPAYAVCQQVKEEHPGKDIRIILSGPAHGRMGKQHNLAAGTRHAIYDVIGSMDADVLVEPDTLAAGLRYVALSQTGVAYFLPVYSGPGPAGGLLVALYSNYYYQLYMGALALTMNAPFITGALWLIRKASLQQIGGLQQFSLTVSDDAAIGKAILQQKLKNVLIPRTVSIPYEQVDLSGGVKHLLKWMAMLRSEGIPTFLMILLSWHPILWSFITFILGLLFYSSQKQYLIYSTVLLLSALTVKLASGFTLNRRIYSISGQRKLIFLPAYELLAVPVLFGKGFFQRTIEWRGRRYRLGRHGSIQAMSDQAPSTSQ